MASHVPHEPLRRRSGYSADERGRWQERASKWLVVLACVWVSFVILQIPSVPRFILSAIRVPSGEILVALLVLGFVGGGRSN
jgi:hypothetical protein